MPDARPYRRGSFAPELVVFHCGRTPPYGRFGADAGGDGTEREAYLAALDAGDWKALERAPIRHRGAVVRQIPLEGAVKNEISLFYQSGLPPEPVLPGSSLKGALRTGLLSVRTKHDPKDKKRFEGGALGHFGDARRDPFRVLRVPDLPLGAGATRILPVNGPKGLVEPLECLPGLLTHGEERSFPFELRFDEPLKARGERLRDWRGKKDRDRPPFFARTFAFADLAHACNEHYGRVFRDEARRFRNQSPFFREHEHFRPGDGEILIRLGRHGHIESKTIAVARKQSKTRFLAAGAPMGWALLRPCP